MHKLSRDVLISNVNYWTEHVVDVKNRIEQLLLESTGAWTNCQRVCDTKVQPRP